MIAATRVRTRLRRTLTCLILLCVALAGGRVWIGHAIDRAVRSRIADAAERAGMQASVGDVLVDLGGAVTVRGVALRREGAEIHVREVRVEADPFALLDSPLSAVTAVSISAPELHLAGARDAGAAIDRARALMRELGTRDYRAGDVAPGSVPQLPPLTVREARVRSDAHTVLTSDLDGAPDGRGGYRWTASGVAAVEGDVAFTAEGTRRPGEGLGVARVTFQRPIGLPGPRGSRLTGVRTVSYEHGLVRTGQAVMSDAAGSVLVRTLGAELDLGNRSGRADGPVVMSLDGHVVTARSLESLDGVRVRATGLELAEPGRHARIGEVTGDTERGHVNGLDLDVRLDLYGGVHVRADRFAAVVSLVGGVPWQKRLAGRTTLQGVRVEARGLVLAFESLDLSPNGDGWTVQGNGRIHRGAESAPVVLAGSLASDLRPETARVAVTGAPLAWAPIELDLGPEAHLDLSLDLARADGGGVRATGSVALRGVVVHEPWLAPEPVGPLAVRADLDVHVDRARSIVDVDLRDVVSGGARAAFKVALRGPGRRPHLDLTVKVPKQRCDRIAAAIPGGLRPGLPDLRVDGTAWLDARLRVDLADTSRIRLDVDGSLEECRIRTLGEALDRRLASLTGPFVHRPEVDGEPVGVSVGPGTAGYVPLSEIPAWVPKAALATEDLAFYKHQGFRASLIRGALKLNLRHGRYVYGGSSITQQLVKNLFLTRRKDLARKLEEALIVVQLERTLTKDRILELYLNCIEYGPGVWGLAAGAATYFGKAATDLAPVEGVYLMAIKPYPRYGYNSARSGRWPSNWVTRMRRIVKRVHELGAIDDEQLAAAGPAYRPVFVAMPAPPALERRAACRPGRGKRSCAR